MTRPIRFCLLSTFYPPWNFGGDGIQVQRLAHALADRGHSVTVVCAPKVHRLLGHRRVAAPPPHPRVDIVPLRDGLPSLTGAYLTGRPLRSRRRLDRLLDGGFDVVHFHNPSLLGAPALLGLGAGIKLYTAHEQWLLCPSHVLFKGGRVCEQPPCRSCEVAHLRPPQPWRRGPLLERSLGNLDALILPSRTSARLHKRFAELVRLEVIRHFVPASVGGGDAPVARKRPYFLYCGRLEPIKGVETLIEAWGRGRAEDLVIAGDGGLKRRLRRRARHLPNVRFAGQLSTPELAPLYRDAIAVVMPTLGHEVLPLVALEAFTAATPAIVHRFGALAELIDETGAGIAYGSPGELDAALDLLAGDGGLRGELGRRGSRAFGELFSVDAHLERYFSLIAELASARGDGELAARAEAAKPGTGAVGVAR